MTQRPTTASGAMPYCRRRPERTLLYRTVQTHFETWLALRRSGYDEADAVPGYVEREFRRYLECGILAHGFARARCAQCGHHFLIAFSCKGRGICPSCNTRRMAETAAHLTDHVLPALPVRQWVLAVPKRLRYFLERDAPLQGVALRLFVGAVEQCLRAHSAGAGRVARIGAIAFIHRFGSTLNAHLHFHCVVIDGVFAPTITGGAVFHPATAIDGPTIAAVQAKVQRRLLASFVRRGLLPQADAQAMAHWAHGGGFSVDGSVRIEAADRAGRERLLRYCARPPLALERLRELDAAHLLYDPAKASPGRASSLIVTPLELLDRLAALVPPPRLHRHRYFGVLAPHSPLRAAVTAMATTPPPPPPVPTPPPAAELAPRHSVRYAWARLLARIYEAFPLLCAFCGAQMRIVAFLTDPTSVREILAHLGEPIRPPVIAPARAPPRWDMPEAGQGDFDPYAQPAPANSINGLLGNGPSALVRGPARAWCRGQPRETHRGVLDRRSQSALSLDRPPDVRSAVTPSILALNTLRTGVEFPMR